MTHDDMPVTAANTLSKDYNFTPEHFELVRDELYQFAGIVLADHKINMVYNRLIRRIRALSLNNFDDYFCYLRETPAEHPLFINSLTTNLTAFFREKHHFDFIEQTILPELAAAGQRRIRAWSAGCSMGEEPYSLAITLLNSAVDLSSCDLKILATDIDSNVLDSARSGIYPLERIESLPISQPQRWFLKGTGANRGQVRIRPELQRLVTFNHLNLMHDWPMKGPFDFIFCRNVMIYFDKQHQEKLLNRMADLLKPGGYLFVGHSESLARQQQRFRLIGNTIYQKER
ncbi:CheR family methyltransferase [Amphritea sp. HPY]|uniref:CheR family methyltransferase n=1 Tax=Amphritea sp. HPY TaxID=3421652 RepID=UPI003D7EB932